MANSELQGQSFDIDKKIKNHLNLIFNAYKGAKNEEGHQRLKKLIDKDGISYEQLKLIKNFFDNYQGSRKSTPYLLNGGTLMKNWVEKTLSDARQRIKGTKDSMDNIGASNKIELPNVRIDNEDHDSDTNKILRQEGIYNMRLIENLITIFDKNKKLCQDQHNQSHQF
jgi:hypothetical protein